MSYDYCFFILKQLCIYYFIKCLVTMRMISTEWFALWYIWEILLLSSYSNRAPLVTSPPDPIIFQCPMCPLPTCHGFLLLLKTNPCTQWQASCMIIEYLFQNWQQDCKASQSRTARQAEPGLRRTQAKAGALALRITKSENNTFFDEEKTYVS